MKIQNRIMRNVTMAGLLAVTVAISACSSDDDDDEVNPNPNPNPNLTTVDVTLDSASTVPPAVGADDATGTGSFTVDTDSGVVTGSVTVSGTTGMPTVAHIHAGEAGTAGEILITLEGSEENTVWTVTEDDNTLSAAEIALFEAGETYINVHTEANQPGELRAQLNVGAAETTSLTISFTNTSETMPMTPPVVALHNAPDAAENGIRLFEVGQPASAEVIAIAEDGNNAPLVELATGQIEAGTVSAAGVAFTDPDDPGPLLPGTSSSIELELVNEDQVLSIVSMIVCSNDGFSGIDSQVLSADPSDSFTAPIYDAGSETNVETLDYWVAPCGTEENLGDEENGSITPHPGQANAENADFNFEAGVDLLEVTVTRN